MASSALAWASPTANPGARTEARAVCLKRNKSNNRYQILNNNALPLASLNHLQINNGERGSPVGSIPLGGPRGSPEQGSEGRWSRRHFSTSFPVVIWGLPSRAAADTPERPALQDKGSQPSRIRREARVHAHRDHRVVSIVWLSHGARAWWAGDSLGCHSRLPLHTRSCGCFQHAFAVGLALGSVDSLFGRVWASSVAPDPARWPSKVTVSIVTASGSLGAFLLTPVLTSLSYRSLSVAHRTVGLSLAIPRPLRGRSACHVLSVCLML